MKTRTLKSVTGIAFIVLVSLSILSFSKPGQQLATKQAVEIDHPTLHKTVKVNGLDIFYREAGDLDKPTILLLHGYPTSSHMFRNLITDLSVRYHVLAPDYPGFGRSDQPAIAEFEYSFDNMAKIVEGFLAAKKVDKYSIYLMDYGAPIGFRIAAKYPEG